MDTTQVARRTQPTDKRTPRRIETLRIVGMAGS